MGDAAAIRDAAASRSVLLSRRFKSLLEKHFAPSTTRRYARLLNVTERALNEATRQALGSTAPKLIRERVMLEAKRLLLHSEVNVAEIATTALPSTIPPTSAAAFASIRAARRSTSAQPRQTDI